MRRYMALTTAAVVGTFMLGCNSISSTLVNRTDNDQFFGNSNGKPCSKCQTRPFKGVPITMRVPTHLEISVKETIFLEVLTEKNRIQQVSTPRRHLFIETNLVETDKVITVDPKRPGGGMLNYSMTFGKKDVRNDHAQYFSEIKSYIVDRTIQDVNNSLQNLFGQQITKQDDFAPQQVVNAPPDQTPPAVPPSQPQPDLQNLIEEHRVVAWKRFDIDAADFEHQVADFVNQHLHCDSQPIAIVHRPTPSVR
ncbi:MAG: hypothetical protein HY290_06860 [Planctomycetia bacterium]|nr:hypothetical protein [Planctomycetia bacterium]